MVRASGGDDFVAWGFRGIRLEIFLQRTFGILHLGQLVHVIQLGLKLFEDGGKSTVLTAIQIHRPDDSLKGIREDGGTAASTICLLTPAHDEVFAEIEMEGAFGERGLIHHPGTAFGEGAFIRIGKAIVEFAGKAELEDGVTEEFQALIVLRFTDLMGHGGMREGKAQELRLEELVAQNGFQLCVRAQVMDAANQNGPVTAYFYLPLSTSYLARSRVGIL